MPHARFPVVALLLATIFPSWSTVQTQRDPLAPLQETISAAEASLQEGELQIAESRYRSALMQAWMFMGGLHAGEGRFAEARGAFERASTMTVQPRDALHSVALVELQAGEATEAVRILTRLVGANAKDVASRRLLAQALVASGHAEQGVQELEEARAVAPDDPELQFLLASGYLRVKRVEAAERLLAQIAKARPIPPTYVLIGRTYRDFGEYDRARSALNAALKKDPRVRRAHYYLGTVALLVEGMNGLAEAIEAFQQELELAPTDPLTNLRLGMALVEAQRPVEALPALEIAARSESPPPDAFHYLGRCQLALARPSEAVAALRRALALTEAQRPMIDETRLGNIHYMLAQALRKLGATDEAAAHFAEAERSSMRRAETSRERLARYMADVPDPDLAPARPAIDPSFPFASLPPDQRAELKRRLTAALARGYLNLGIMQARADRFARAADFFEQAAAVDVAFPQVQYSLGVAYFNAQQYDKAMAPLERALASDPANANVRRMLALTWLNMEAYDKAAEALKDDSRRETDPALQYAFGVALVRSNRAAEAETAFSQLLAKHGESPEVAVVLGQAHAQQGDFESVVRTLQRAITLKSDIRDAHAALGVIYLKQGRWQEAADALRAELAAYPDHYSARHNLATVLDLQGSPQAALSELRTVLRSKPQFADARYLLDKILLAQGAAPEAVQHLETAARLEPDEPNIHYQLAQAYQKLGRTDLAERHFDIYRKLKDKRRGGSP